jgi:hypothetical protein
MKKPLTDAPPPRLREEFKNVSDETAAEGRFVFILLCKCKEYTVLLQAIA